MTRHCTYLPEPSPHIATHARARESSDSEGGATRVHDPRPALSTILLPVWLSSEHITIETGGKKPWPRSRPRFCMHGMGAGPAAAAKSARARACSEPEPRTEKPLCWPGGRRIVPAARAAGSPYTYTTWYEARDGGSRLLAAALARCTHRTVCTGTATTHDASQVLVGGKGKTPWRAAEHTEHQRCAASRALALPPHLSRCWNYTFGRNGSPLLIVLPLQLTVPRAPQDGDRDRVWPFSTTTSAAQ
jgi:hypothetical protein